MEPSEPDKIIEFSPLPIVIVPLAFKARISLPFSLATFIKESDEAKARRNCTYSPILINSLIYAPVPKIIFSASILPSAPFRIIFGSPISFKLVEERRVSLILKPPIVPLAAEMSPLKEPVAA
jgi:hypothetical protein